MGGVLPLSNLTREIAWSKLCKALVSTACDGIERLSLPSVRSTPRNH